MSSLQRIRHRAEVGADIDRVGDEQQRHDDAAARSGSAGRDCRRCRAGGAADAGADLLDRDHQGIGEQHCPADAEAELRAGLAVSADAGGIVVEAPVMSPGPRTPMKRRMGPVSTGLSVFFLYCCHAVPKSQPLIPLRREHNGAHGPTSTQPSAVCPGADNRHRPAMGWRGGVQDATSCREHLSMAEKLR